MPSACCGDSSTTSSPAMAAGQPSQCAGCGGQIGDRYFLNAADQQWHIQCLRCFDCKLQLDSELTCYSKDGKIYCKDDYFKRFSVKRCARCYLAISSNEMVMRAKGLVFHLMCFTCTACSRPLNPGDYFGMRDEHVYCRLHYEMICVGPMDHQNPPPMSGMFTGLTPTVFPNSGMAPNNSSPPAGAPYYNGLGHPHSHPTSPHPFNHHKGRPRKRKGDIMSDFCAGLTDLDGHHGYEGDVYHPHPPPPRSKRMRTSFKHHQLRTMKSYFSVNHNPDAKDLKQLAQKTGLTKRVLQVWFQNARAKYRRTILKKDKDGKDISSNDSNTSKSPGDDDDNVSPLPDQEEESEAGSDHTKELHGSDGESLDDKHVLDDFSEIRDNLQNESPNNSPESLVSMANGITYSELKTASPALADEVSSVSSMPAKRSNCLSIGGSNEAEAVNMQATSLNTNFLPGYAEMFRS
ncbi:LIM/homeobox protein Lhx9-like isoform X2 [Apostichopus japonicus]